MSVGPPKVRSIRDWYENSGDAPGDASTPYHFLDTDLGGVFSCAETF